MKLLFYIFIGLVLATQSYALFGNKRCTWGPSYWCNHVGSAKECGALSYCSKMWKTDSTQPKGSMECKFFKLLVQDFDTLLKKNSTIDEIKQLALKACPLLKDTSAQKMCKLVISTYLPEIVYMIEEKLTPDQICNALSICHSSGIKDPLFKKIKLVNKPSSILSNQLSPILIHGAPVSAYQNNKKSPNDFCAECEAVLTDVKKMLESNATEAEIAAMLKSVVCTQLGPLKSECDTLVDQYLPEVIQLLDSEIQPKQICTMLGLCPKSQIKVNLLAAVKQTKGALCADCKKTLDDIKKALENNATEQEISSLLKSQVCDHLGLLKLECYQAVDSLVPMVIQWIRANVQPEQICTILGFCTKTHNYKKHPLILLMRIQQSGGFLGGKSAVECEACELLVKEARTLISQKKTEQEIIDFVKNHVCTLMPAEKDKCIAAVTEYGPIIFQLLASELDPTTVCQALGACGKTLTKKTSVVHYPKASTQCILCEFVMRELETLLVNNKTEAAIEHALDEVCSLLPSSIRSECVTFVQQYAPIIIKLIASSVGPKQICTAIGLCSSGMPNATPVKLQPGEVCVMCQTVVIYAKGLMNEKDTQEEMTHVFAKVCNFFPKAEQSVCNAFVDKYAPMLIQALVQEINPKSICSELHLCTTQTQQASVVTKPVFTYHHRVQQGPNGMVQMQMVHDDEV